MCGDELFEMIAAYLDERLASGPAPVRPPVRGARSCSARPAPFAAPDARDCDRCRTTRSPQLVDDLAAEQDALVDVLEPLGARRLVPADAGVELGRPRHRRAPRRHRRARHRHLHRRSARAGQGRRRVRVVRGPHAARRAARPARSRAPRCSRGGSAPRSRSARCCSSSTRRSRVPWGLGMRPPSFVTARLMETWAHALDVHDALGTDAGRHRPAPPRRLDRRSGRSPTRARWPGSSRPTRPLRVELTLPSGATWTFGPDDARRPHHRAGVGVLPGLRAAPRPRRARPTLVAEGDGADARRCAWHAPSSDRLTRPEASHAPLLVRRPDARACTPTAFIAPTATLVGDVIVEEGASVWYGAVLRADYAPVVVRARRQHPGRRGAARPARAHHRGRARARPSPTTASCTARSSARSA